MKNLFFRIDPALGIRKLRQEVWIAMAVTLGIALLVCVELGEERRSKAKTELVMESETFIKAGERILPVNKEIWDLVEGSAEPQLPETQGVRKNQGVQGAQGALLLSVPSAAMAQPAPALPRFPVVGKNSGAVSGNTTAGGTSAATRAPASAPASAPVASEEEVAANYTVPYAGLSTNSLAFDSGALSALSFYKESARDLGLVKGSGVAYKRLDNQAIQNRDAEQAEQIDGLPSGTVIDAELITGIISGSPTKVLMSVKQDVVSREMVVIPAGAILLGTAVPDYKAGRININVERLIYGNAEIKISGLVYDASGQAGLADRRINAAARKLIPAFFAGILAEFGRALSGQQAVIPDLALAKNPETNPMMQVLVDGTGSGLDAVARVLAEQAAQEGTVIIVNPGKLIRIVLLQKIPFDVLVGVRGGSRVR